MLIAYEIPGTDNNRHEVHLKNLEPSVEYYYTIPDLSEKIYKFTAGTKPDTPFRFLCVGDTENTRSDIETFSYYKEINLVSSNFYKKNNHHPAFKLHLGDFVKFGSDFSAWEAHFNSEKIYSSNLPITYTTGNHELKGDYGGNLKYYYNQPEYYSFDYGNAHFLIIHTFDGLMTNHNGPTVTTGSKQYNFIKNDLKKNKDKKWIIVSLHIPILSTGDYNNNELLIEQYFELFRKNKVDLVLSGHDHNFDSFIVDKESEWGGTYYIINGTGGSRIDNYIMDRKNKKWITWIHDRNSKYGLYQSDKFTKKHHIYGEISWGFLDVKVDKNLLSISYYRWLNFEKFLKITNQERKTWKIIPFDMDAWKKYDLNEVILAKKLIKRRKF